MDDRYADKQTPILLKALRLALVDVEEHRLFKAGKLDGLFPGRGGPAGLAAALALRDGYLETVRTEVKGKIAIEWVRLTPKGVEFIYRNDSPRAVLDEMRHLMHDARAGVPAWLSAIHDQLLKLSTTFTDDMQRYLQRLDALTRRVEEALRRVEADIPSLAEPLRNIIPWGLAALTYLDHRRMGGKPDPCPLPELFAAVRQKHPHLGISDFQNGLRRLADNRALKLSPMIGRDLMPEPEHAIPDGAHMLYFASR